MLQISVAQKEGNIWFFGNYAGLDFKNGNPISISSGKTKALEGCASICDANGDLLFYTDGIFVWNKNHQKMEVDSLLGHDSSTQSAVIVAAPGTNGLYYIFTTDACHHGLKNGLRYSIVDMKQNGGLGRIDRNKMNILMYPFVCEKLAAIQHCNGKDIWVVSHEYNSDNYISFLLTENGINMIPVISKTGVIYYGSTDPNDLCKELGSARGYLKASPDGSVIVSAISRSKLLELSKFDNKTGEIFNTLLFDNIDESYGVEFSPNGNLLYVSTTNSNAYPTSNLYQFDISIWNKQTIWSSLYPILVNGNSKGALQIGPDKKIYVAEVGISNLSVINYPNEKGKACGYTQYAVVLSGSSYYGLPVMMNNRFFLSLKQKMVACNSGSDGEIQIDISNPNNYNFSIDNGVSYSKSTSFSGLKAGIYTLNILSEKGCIHVAKSIITEPPKLTMSLGLYSKLTTCIGADLGSIQMVANGGTGTKYFSILNGQSFYTYNHFDFLKSGVYVLKVKDDNQCLTSDTVEITENREVILSNIDYKAKLDCYHDNSGYVSLSVVGGTPEYSSTLTVEKQFNPKLLYKPISAGIYKAQIKDKNGCVSEEKDITITEPPQLFIVIKNVTDRCYGDNDAYLKINNWGGTTPYNFQINTIHYNDSIYLKNMETGLYQIISKDKNNCIIDTIVGILQPELLKITILAQKNSFCANNPNGALHIAANGGFSPYKYALDNGNWSEIGNFTALKSGIHKVEAKDANDCKTELPIVLENIDELKIDSIKILNTCNKGGNGSIELKTTGGILPHNVLWDDGSKSPNRVDLFNGKYSVRINDNVGCEVNDTLEILDFNCEDFIYVPNIFTPNNDGTNDIFKISASYLERFHGAVYNRWGQLLYEWNDPNSGWDGRNQHLTPVPEGVYYCIIIAKPPNGKEIVYKSFLQLMR